MKIIITSGYFDPVHVGHVECLELARGLGDKLIVIINNDHQAHLKKGKAFMSDHDRSKIIQAFADVDEVFISIDTDNSVCKSIEAVWRQYTGIAEEIIFAKGGDRMSSEIPEATLCNSLNIKIVDGLGAKIRSSSDLTAAYAHLLKIS
jgi:D-beta-D-heptose 7-phosphate kinase/D-beta-D-heptose 1-phosphate adenosyltransferase